MYAANQERLSSAVVRQIMSNVGANAALQETLGDAIRFEPVWWLNGDPYIKGGVSCGAMCPGDIYSHRLGPLVARQRGSMLPNQRPQRYVRLFQTVQPTY